jgi:hypothetical protein
MTKEDAERSNSDAHNFFIDYPLIKWSIIFSIGRFIKYPQNEWLIVRDG